MAASDRMSGTVSVAQGFYIMVVHVGSYHAEQLRIMLLSHSFALEQQSLWSERQPVPSWHEAMLICRLVSETTNTLFLITSHSRTIKHVIWKPHQTASSDNESRQPHFRY